MLVATAEERAIQRGMSAVILKVLPDNRAAVSLYGNFTAPHSIRAKPYSKKLVVDDSNGDLASGMYRIETVCLSFPPAETAGYREEQDPIALRSTIRLLVPPPVIPKLIKPPWDCALHGHCKIS